MTREEAKTYIERIIDENWTLRGGKLSGAAIEALQVALSALTEDRWKEGYAPSPASIREYLVWNGEYYDVFEFDPDKDMWVTTAGHYLRKDTAAVVAWREIPRV